MNMKSLIKPFWVLLIVSSVLVAAGCRHTAHGFGRDVEKAGEKIQEKTN